MKYPSNVDVSLVIRYAMHIRSPQQYDCPPGAYRTPTLATPATTTSSLSKTAPSAAISSGDNATVHRRAYSNDADHKHPVTTSATDIREPLKTPPRTMQNSASLAALRMTAQTQALRHQSQQQQQHHHQRTDMDAGIVEGFRENVSTVWFSWRSMH